MRSYWWSSKPTAPAAGSNEGALGSSASDGDVVAALSSIQEGSTLTHPSTDLGGQPEPSASHADQVSSASSGPSLQDSAVQMSNPTSDLASSLPTSELASTIPPNDALGSLEALQAATTEFSALASLDYSHLFSWGWPAGTFLRVFAFFQDIPILSTSPITCMVLGVLFFRLPLSYFQLRGQKAQAAWAPYQEEFKALSEEYKAATASGNNARALETGRRMMLIREKTNFSPFAGLLPAFGLGYVGIGSFLGMGRLAAYQKEVIAMGGTGPLANPEGFLATGWLADLTVFDPALWVLFSALTWLNVRRSALDSPKYSVWMTRMPHLITPVFAVISVLARFSAAQMIVGGASIGYTVAQSYALRVPTIRRMAGMQGVKNQGDTLKFPGFRESWEEAIAYVRNWNEDFLGKRMESPFPNGPIRTRSGTEIPAPQINRNQLRVKEAPPSAPKLLANPNTPDAPPPPAGMLVAMKNEDHSVVQAQSSARGAAQSNPPKTEVPGFKFPPRLQKDKPKLKGKVTAKKGK
jgi:hypothetical protein